MVMMRGLILNNPPPPLSSPLFLAPKTPTAKDAPPPRRRLISTKSNHRRDDVVIPIRCKSSASEIDMFLNPVDNTYSAHQPRAVVLWDLDNKPPRGPPYDAALSLRRLASLFGRVDSFSAYANRHAFLHLPPWVLHQRRQQRHRDLLERKGLLLHPDPSSSSSYSCGVCGRKFPTNLQLKKHFKQLHERERLKKLSRMRSLKGKKRQRYKERFVSNNLKYQEAARQLLTPKKGYGLDAELRRAGVFVKTVEDKPQAADAALKRQMLHWMGSRVDWMFLVSDDSDFAEMVSKAREARLQTVVVGDRRTVLGKHADFWVPWMRVESGEVGREEVMRSTRGGNFGWDKMKEEGLEAGAFLSARFYEGGGDDEIMEDGLRGMADEIVSRTSAARFSATNGDRRMSAFSEEEGVFDEDVDLENDDFSISGSALPGDDAWLSDSEDEDDYYI